MVRGIEHILISAAKEEFLSDSDAALIHVGEEPNKVIQRIILSLAKITVDD